MLTIEKTGASIEKKYLFQIKSGLVVLKEDRDVMLGFCYAVKLSVVTFGTLTRLGSRT